MKFVLMLIKTKSKTKSEKHKVIKTVTCRIRELFFSCLFSV